MSKLIPFETTLEVRDGCLCLHAQRAARALSRHFDEVFRLAGLTNQQFSLLMALNRPTPPTMAPVAELLGLDRTTLTAALKPLQRRGLLVVETDSSDRRSRRLRLTETGHELLMLTLPLWRQTHANIGSAHHDIDIKKFKLWLQQLGSNVVDQ